MISFDFRAFERAARDMNAAADQIPFALAQSLNTAVDVTRAKLIGVTWAQHVTVRNPNFLKAALTSRGMRASKRNLRAGIFDRLERGSLLLHADGGVRQPKGSAIAVPTRALTGRRTGKGVPKGMRPATAPNTFKKGDVLYQRIGTYKKKTKSSAAQDNRGLKLLYVLAPSVPIKADVPFEADFDRIMSVEVWKAFGPRVKAAMASRR